MKLTKSKLKEIIKEELIKEGRGKRVNVGFSKEMGALYVRLGSGKSVELFKDDVELINKAYKKHKKDMD